MRQKFTSFQISVRKQQITFKNETKEIDLDVSSTMAAFKQLAQIFNQNIKRIALYDQNTKTYYYNTEKTKIPDQPLQLKYIGIQISYKTVFVLEYITPMIGFTITRYLAKKSLKSVTSLFYLLHFCKRLFETLFVHTFSHATMPIKNVFKNCIYYCGYGCLNGYVNRDIFIEQLFKNNKESIILSCLLIGACTTETLNGYCHLYLRLLRRGKSGYQNPKSIWFKYCACPNYKFEILSWFQYSLFTRSWAAFAFCLTGAYQMNTWAEQKRKRLNDLYKDSYRKYKIFIGW